MFFGSSRMKVFKISWFDFEQHRKNQCKKKEHNQHILVFKV